jgi:hypothetical protein
MQNGSGDGIKEGAGPKIHVLHLVFLNSFFTYLIGYNRIDNNEKVLLSPWFKENYKYDNVMLNKGNLWISLIQ